MEFQNHIEYIIIPATCTGKRKAFEKGWKAKLKGKIQKENPYDPRMNDWLPTNPYYKFWDLGFECCS